jgi:hypothetical protein
MVKYLLYIALFLVIMRVGLWLIRGFGRPVPPPPPPGELRKVDLRFRCGVCGAEIRMTAAANEDPEPPRHCMEEMQLVAPAIE